MTQEEIKAAAILFAKKHKLEIAKGITNPEIYLPSKMPVSVFMAGSPGAGKTEFSKSLLEIFERRIPRVIRIDGDELRTYFSEYTGSNSKLFQGAISILVEKVHDLALKQNQNFILDGTFWRKDKAIANIDRSLAKKRAVFIFYVYQEPEIAWKFTKKREVLEGRNIPKYAFIDQLVGARNTANHVRSSYGEEVTIMLVKKNYEKNTVEKLIEIQPGETVDQYLPKIYTKTALKKTL